jgi:hypothetical protein
MSSHRSSLSGSVAIIKEYSGTTARFSPDNVGVNASVALMIRGA